MYTHPTQFNKSFSDLLDSPEGRTKTAAASQAFVRDHLREDAACRRLMNPEPIDIMDRRVIPMKNSDTIVVRKDLEPNSRAMSLTFGDTTDARIVTGKRIDVSFHKIQTEVFQIHEQALLAYEAPVTKLIEENTGKDIQEIEDHSWLVHSEAAVAASGQLIMGEQATADYVSAGDYTGNRFDIERPDFVSMKNLMLADGNRKRLERLWMNEIDYNNIEKWTVEDVGDTKQGEMLVDGYKYDRIADVQVVRTIKTDLLQTGNIYGYAPQEFLGFFYTLNDVKFYIDKRYNLIEWAAWEDIGICFANISSIIKMELYNGQSDGVGGSDTLPGESDLFQQTNPVWAGGSTAPSVELS